MASKSDERMDRSKEISDFTTVAWTEHPLHFLNRLKSVIGPDGAFKHDVKIVCEGGSVKCHKMILAMCSPYFAKIFKKSKLGQKQRLMLPIVSKRTFSFLYEYICNGSVTLPMDQKNLLIEIGNILQVEGLMQYAPLQKDKFVSKSEKGKFFDIGTQTNPVKVYPLDSDDNENKKTETNENLEMENPPTKPQPPVINFDDSNLTKGVILGKLVDQNETPKEKPGPSWSEAKEDSNSGKESTPVTNFEQNETTSEEKSKADLLAFINDSSDDSDFVGPSSSKGKIQSPKINKARSSEITKRLRILPIVKSSMPNQLTSRRILKRKRMPSCNNNEDGKTNDQTKKKMKRRDEESNEIIACEFQDCEFVATNETEMNIHNDQHNARH